MNQITLTDEQLAVMHHPMGRHARVLAVAGSGKSFTMACRIQHLVMDCHIPPHSIKVLMFNRLAR
jgi:DNA helicase-2/ATP-dependent DNA helicase PcrA